MTKESVYQIIGWVGAALVLTAFALTTLGQLSSSSATAAILNIIGGVGVAAVSWRRRAYQPLVINLVWTAVALAALFRAVS